MSLVGEVSSSVWMLHAVDSYSQASGFGSMLVFVFVQRAFVVWVSVYLVWLVFGAVLVLEIGWSVAFQLVASLFVAWSFEFDSVDHVE